MRSTAAVPRRDPAAPARCAGPALAAPGLWLAGLLLACAAGPEAPPLPPVSAAGCATALECLVEDGTLAEAPDVAREIGVCGRYGSEPSVERREELERVASVDGGIPDEARCEDIREHTPQLYEELCTAEGRATSERRQARRERLWRLIDNRTIEIGMTPCAAAAAWGEPQRVLVPGPNAVPRGADAGFGGETYWVYPELRAWLLFKSSSALGARVSGCGGRAYAGIAASDPPVISQPSFLLGEGSARAERLQSRCPYPVPRG